MDNNGGADGNDAERPASTARGAARIGSTADVVDRLQRDGELSESEAESVKKLLQDLKHLRDTDRNEYVTSFRRGLGKLYGPGRAHEMEAKIKAKSSELVRQYSSAAAAQYMQRHGQPMPSGGSSGISTEAPPAPRHSQQTTQQSNTMQLMANDGTYSHQNAMYAQQQQGQQYYQQQQQPQQQQQVSYSNSSSYQQQSYQGNTGMVDNQRGAGGIQTGTTNQGGSGQYYSQSQHQQSHMQLQQQQQQPDLQWQMQQQQQQQMMSQPQYGGMQSQPQQQLPKQGGGHPVPAAANVIDNYSQQANNKTKSSSKKTNNAAQQQQALGIGPTATFVPQNTATFPQNTATFSGIPAGMINTVGINTTVGNGIIQPPKKPKAPRKQKVPPSDITDALMKPAVMPTFSNFPLPLPPPTFSNVPGGLYNSLGGLKQASSTEDNAGGAAALLTFLPDPPTSSSAVSSSFGVSSAVSAAVSAFTSHPAGPGGAEKKKTAPKPRPSKVPTGGTGVPDDKSEIGKKRKMDGGVDGDDGSNPSFKKVKSEHGAGAGANQNNSNSTFLGGGMSSAVRTETMLELDNELERPTMEGMHVGADRNIAEDVIGDDFLGDEEQIARRRMREGLMGHVVGSVAAAGNASMGGGGGSGAMMSLGSSGGGAYAITTRPAATIFVPKRPIVAGALFNSPKNIADSEILEPIRVEVQERSGVNIGAKALEYLSHNIQAHITTILEGCIKNSKARRNVSAFKLFQDLNGKVRQGGGDIPNRESTLGFIFGPNVREILEKEERKAREELRKREKSDEEFIVREMKAREEERQKVIAGAGSKRKATQLESEMGVPWWVKEDAAEKAGVLSWEDLSKVNYRQSVAREHKLIGSSSSRRGGGSGAAGRASDASSLATSGGVIMGGTTTAGAAAGSSSSSSSNGNAAGVFAVPVGRAASSSVAQGPGALTGTSALLAAEVGLPAAAQGDVILQQDVISVLSHCARPRGGGPLSAALGLSLQRAKWGLPVARNQPAYLTAVLPPSSLVYSSSSSAKIGSASFPAYSS